MYIILVYDIGEKRVTKMLKLCRRYLSWIQNSVFEGALTGVQLKQLKAEAKEIMQNADSLIFFSSKDERWLEKEVIGEERGATGQML
jgi:CRISPR-associated protein Cas2